MTDTKTLSDKYIMHTYNRFDIEITSGEGVYLTDANGKRYLDFTAGIAVNSLGYGNKKSINAIMEQLSKFNHCSNLYYSRPQAEVAELIVENSCFDKVFFCNSGAEAVETMLKIAHKYGNSKHKECTKIITMKNSFHGRTLGAITATGQTKYQKGFEPLIPDIDYAEFNNLESVKSLTDKNTCAVIVEPIQGEGGLIPAEKSFLEGLRKLCDQNDILLGFDEVQCGIGRSGKLFAHQFYQVEPDMISMAKGLANGIPIGVCAARGKASEILAAGDHASTFGGNPIACSSAKVVLDEIINEKLLENVSDTGEYLKSELVKLSEKYSLIKEVRGLGLMLGMEFNIPVKEILTKCTEKGLLLIAAGSNVIRFVPPLIITKNDADTAIEILDKIMGEFDE